MSVIDNGILVVSNFLEAISFRINASSFYRNYLSIVRYDLLAFTSYIYLLDKRHDVMLWNAVDIKTYALLNNKQII